MEESTQRVSVSARTSSFEHDGGALCPPPAHTPVVHRRAGASASDLGLEFSVHKRRASGAISGRFASSSADDVLETQHCKTASDPTFESMPALNPDAIAKFRALEAKTMPSQRASQSWKHKALRSWASALPTASPPEASPPPSPRSFVPDVGGAGAAGRRGHVRRATMASPTDAAGLLSGSSAWNSPAFVVPPFKSKGSSPKGSSSKGSQQARSRGGWTEGVQPDVPEIRGRRAAEPAEKQSRAGSDGAETPKLLTGVGSLTNEQLEVCDLMKLHEMIEKFDRMGGKVPVPASSTSGSTAVRPARVPPALPPDRPSRAGPPVPRRSTSLPGSPAGKGAGKGGSPPPLPRRTVSLVSLGTAGGEGRATLRREGSGFGKRALSGDLLSLEVPPGLTRPLTRPFFTPDEYDAEGIGPAEGEVVDDPDDCLRQNIIPHTRSLASTIQLRETILKSRGGLKARQVGIPLSELTEEEIERQSKQWSEVLQLRNTSADRRSASLRKYAAPQQGCVGTSGALANPSERVTGLVRGAADGAGEEEAPRELKITESLQHFGTPRGSKRSLTRTASAAILGSGTRKDVAEWQRIGQLAADVGVIELVRSRHLKDLVRRGIPDEQRSQLWPLLSGAAKKQSARPTLYGELVRRQGLAAGSADAEQIERDLNRTLLGKTRLTTEEELAPLRRVLLAFSTHHKSIGYTQSMNVFSAMLLLFMNEELVFFVLDALVCEFLPDYYSSTMSGLQVDLRVMTELLKSRAPRLHKHLSRFGFRTMVSGFLTQWFLCLFVNVLPVETCLRVWDCFFCEGPKVFFRVGLALFLCAERALMQVGDESALMEALRKLPRTAVYCDLFLEYAFAIPSFRHSWLTQLRSQFHVEVANEIMRKVEEDAAWERELASRRTEDSKQRDREYSLRRDVERLDKEEAREAEKERVRQEAIALERERRAWRRSSWQLRSKTNSDEVGSWQFLRHGDLGTICDRLVL